MELVKVELQAPKEILELEKFIVELVDDIVKKKSLEAIFAENLPNVIKAIDGVQKLPEEFKQKEALNVGLLLAADIAKIFMK